MARLQVKGLNEYTKSIQKLYKDSEVIMKRSIYPAAGFVVDNMKKAIQSLPIEEGPSGLPPYGTVDKPLNGISRRQKADLLEGMGISLKLMRPDTPVKVIVYVAVSSGRTASASNFALIDAAKLCAMNVKNVSIIIIFFITNPCRIFQICLFVRRIRSWADAFRILS